MSIKDRAKEALRTASEVRVPVDEIRPYEGQPRERFAPEKLRLLADSIDAGGQSTPGLIRHHPDGNGYQLIDGERRWRAMHLIPSARRPLYRASLVDIDDEGAQFLLSGVANLNREGHTPIEAMRSIDRLRGLGLTMEEVAELFGKSAFWCYQMHSLKNLVPEVLKMVDPDLPRDKQIPVTAAVAIAKADPTLHVRLANRVLRGEITTASIRDAVVKVSAREGKQVRVREQPPMKQWESFQNRVKVGSQSLSGAADLIGQGQIDRIVRAHRPETDRVLTQLRRSREAIEKLEKAITMARV